MKKTVRFLALALILIMAAGLFAGCAQKKTKSSGKSDDQVNLIYYVWGSETELSVIKEIVADFEALNSNIKISIERAGNDYFGMLANRFAGGNEPDIFFMDPGEFSTFARKNLLLNMSDYIKSSSALKESDLWSVNDVYRYDGKDLGKGDLYALIKDWSPDFMMFYNKKHFDEAGISYPSQDVPMTWDEFMQMAKKLNKKDSAGKIIRSATSMDFEPYKHLFEYVQQTGSNMFKDNYTKTNFSDSNVRSAIDFFVNLQKGDDAPAKYGTGSQTSVSGEKFSVGDISIVWSGRWAYVAYGWDKVNFEVGIAPPPVPKAGMQPYAVTSGMISHAVSANSLYKDEAYKFVEYYMTEGMKKVAKTGFNIPGNKTVAKDVFQNVENQKQKAINDYFIKIAENYTKPVDYNPYITQARFTSILSREMTLVFENKQSVDKALETAARDIDDAIAKTKK